MASRDALAIRRDAAFARIAAAAGVQPPAANRDPDVTLTRFVEWAADLIAGPVEDEPEAAPAVADEPTEEVANPARTKRKAG